MTDETAGTPEHGADEEKWPVGFMLTVAMAGLYLAYRLVQGIVVFADWIF